jgi:hypothetical protein
MGIAFLILQEHLRDSNNAVSATLLMTSTLILIGMRRIRHLELLLIFAFSPRSRLMASTGNDGAVQLWQDGEKMDNGCCQCDCSFFYPMDSYFA